MRQLAVHSAALTAAPAAVPAAPAIAAATSAAATSATPAAAIAPTAIFRWQRFRGIVFFCAAWKRW